MKNFLSTLLLLQLAVSKGKNLRSEGAKEKRKGNTVEVEADSESDVLDLFKENSQFWGRNLEASMCMSMGIAPTPTPAPRPKQEPMGPTQPPTKSPTASQTLSPMPSDRGATPSPPTFAVCLLCVDGSRPCRGDTLIQIGLNNTAKSCIELFDDGLNGKIAENVCPVLQKAVSSPCGCNLDC